MSTRKAGGMNWRSTIVALGITLPILAVLGYGLTRDPRDIPSPLPGRDAPEFVLPVMDSPDTVRLSNLRGDVVVLNFWASWCLECRVEHADLAQAATEYGPRGVHFFGVLYDDPPANGRAWISEMGGQPYPSLVDRGSRTAVDYGLFGVPETFIISRAGKIVHKQIGPISFDRLASLIEPLLQQPTTPGAQQ